jgi:hypothetical protein
MRGGQLHNYLADLAIALLVAQGWKVATERRFQRGTLITDIDIWASRIGIGLAIEVETTCRSALRNIAKMHLVPCDWYVVLVPNSMLARRIRQAMRSAGWPAFRAPEIVTLITLRQRLTSVFQRQFSIPEIRNRKEKAP